MMLDCLTEEDLLPQIVSLCLNVWLVALEQHAEEHRKMVVGRKTPLFYCQGGSSRDWDIHLQDFL